jgi:hypothetical protein
MLAALLLVMVTLALSHWLLGPLVLLFTPLLQLSWLGWAALALGLWLLAGGSPGAGADDRDRSRGS